MFLGLHSQHPANNKRAIHNTRAELTKGATSKFGELILLPVSFFANPIFFYIPPELSTHLVLLILSNLLLSLTYHSSIFLSLSLLIPLHFWCLLNIFCGPSSSSPFNLSFYLFRKVKIIFFVNNCMFSRLTKAFSLGKDLTEEKTRKLIIRWRNTSLCGEGACT